MVVFPDPPFELITSVVFILMTFSPFRAPTDCTLKTMPKSYSCLLTNSQERNETGANSLARRVRGLATLTWRCTLTTIRALTRAGGDLLRQSASAGRPRGRV